MKAAIFNPYLDTLGGGERYTVGVIQALNKKGYEVVLEWKDKSILERLESRFGINLKGSKVSKTINRGEGFDVCFWISDGSIPALKARRNYLHFQVPFHDVKGSSLINKVKLSRVDTIICNSYFTKKFIDDEYGVESIVIYPPVAAGKIKSKRKENLIIFIGRFSQLAQAKRQDILIRSFKKFYKSGYKNWRMILAGGAEVGVNDYFEKLKKDAEDYPIEIVESPPFKKIIDIYGKAKIFWSAAGFGINEKKEPEKVEHFGITVVEAMAGGAVPIVFAAGGHKEIVSKGQTGYLWKEERSLVNYTKKLIEEKGLWTQISRAASEASYIYEDARFEKEISQII